MMRNYCLPKMKRPVHQRLIALALLVAYAITGTSVMPAMVAMAAWIDGSHSVVVAQSEEGMEVTLHHRKDQYTPRVSDHDNSLTKLLVSMCKASDAGDHQMRTAHVSSNANIRDAVERQIQKSPTLNFQETHILSLSTSWPLRDVTRVILVQDIHEKCLHPRPIPATVQLLI